MNGPCCSPDRATLGGPSGSGDLNERPTHGIPDVSVLREPALGARRRAIPLPGVRFTMGTDDGVGRPEDEEGPAREVTVNPFAIGATTVTNAEWREFASATGYLTDAERFGWSHVFQGHLSPAAVAAAPRAVSAPWWCAVRGADWAHPEGAGSGINERLDHPVVHVSWRDAAAWCAWAGGRLPTEAEWEYAARGGFEQARYPWGDELLPGGEHWCNIWQGTFPTHDVAADGYAGTAPVPAYSPNAFGLHQTVGNVWEWCADEWRGGRVIKGGSFLCHDSYCNRYRVAARSANGEDASASNAGFRCVWDVPTRSG